MKIIVAHGLNNEIGVLNNLPWRLPPDLAFFMKISKQSSFLISGRKTLMSLPNQRLPGRKIVVISSSHTPLHDEKVLSGLDDLESLDGYSDSLVIGGGEIYKQLLCKCNELLITRVNTTVKGADVFFPEYESAFNLQEVIDVSEYKGLGYEIGRWVRNPP
jgi:dihydrofolate reductase